jgi:hypothetical protein
MLVLEILPELPKEPLRLNELDEERVAPPKLLDDRPNDDEEWLPKLPNDPPPDLLPNPPNEPPPKELRDLPNPPPPPKEPRR